jgi:hypothetical protein
MRMRLTYLTKRVGYRLYEFTHPKEPWIAQARCATLIET